MFEQFHPNKLSITDLPKTCHQVHRVDTTEQLPNYFETKNRLTYSNLYIFSFRRKKFQIYEKEKYSAARSSYLLIQ